MPVFDFNAALRLAELAHANQVDKSGNPYIWHCIAVANKVSEENKIPAVLHDILEDTPMTRVVLLMFGMSEEDLGVLDLLTRKKTGTYRDYIRRLSVNKRAVEIKLADLNHNMSRLSNLEPKEASRLNRRYKWANDYLEGINNNGNMG